MLLVQLGLWRYNRQKDLDEIKWVYHKKKKCFSTKLRRTNQIYLMPRQEVKTISINLIPSVVISKEGSTPYIPLYHLSFGLSGEFFTRENVRWGLRGDTDDWSGEGIDL